MPSIPSPLSAFSEAEQNADFDVSGNRAGVYLATDAAGGARQIVALVGGVASLCGTAKVIAWAGLFFPAIMLFTGPACAAAAIKWTIPDAKEALKIAEAQLKKAETTPSNLVNLNEAQNAVANAKLGLTNHRLFLAMGLAQTALGIGLLGGGIAAVSNCLPALGAAGSSALVVAASVLLGVVYTVRGSVMGYRAYKNYNMVNSFHKEFEENGKKSVDRAVTFMQTQEALGETYLNLRVDKSCLLIKNAQKIVTGRYTAQGIQDAVTGQLSPYNREEKLEYLRRVEKGIYSEKLKHTVSKIIALAMLIGGILAIVAACIASGGTALIVVGIVSAVFFIAMEVIFFTYDSSRIFTRYRDWSYEPLRFTECLPSKNL
ncbi:MAG: hypothetical protein V4487_00780 [Chlamydiota bacterium]